jgi:hypothetical protein
MQNVVRTLNFISIFLSCLPFYIFTESLATCTLQVSNAYLQLRGNDTKMRFEFVKDMPRASQPLIPPDISSEMGKLPFVWITMLLFPV